MATPIEPYMPNAPALSGRSAPPFIDPEEEGQVSRDDSVLLSGGNAQASLSLQAHGRALSSGVMKTMEHDVAGADDGRKTYEDRPSYSSLALCYLPMAVSIPKAAVHLVMQQVLSPQGSL